MKALVQRVNQAQVSVNQQIIGQIQQGLLVYIGLAKEDDLALAKKMIDKILAYRIFENTCDPEKMGKLDKSLTDIGGGLLLVSQFTLMARTDKGRRPDFTDAMPPEPAKHLFEQIIDYAKSCYPNVQTGEFGANMLVSSQNDGPINFLLEVNEK